MKLMTPDELAQWYRSCLHWYQWRRSTWTGPHKLLCPTARMGGSQEDCTCKE